jgi:hypothetical protein
MNRLRRSDGVPGFSLVAGKELVLRAYVRFRRSLAPFSLDAVADACVDGPIGACPPGKSFQATGQSYAFGSQFSDQELEEAVDSINVFLRGGSEAVLTPGVHTIEVRVSPTQAGAFPTVTRKIEALFHLAQTFDLLVYPVAIEDATMTRVLPSASILQHAADFLQATYPVDEQGVTSSIRVPLPFVAPPHDFELQGQLALKVAQRLAMDRKTLSGRRKFGVGVVPRTVDGIPAVDDYNGIGFRDLPDAVVSIDQRDGATVLPATLAHEIGHKLGFDDEYCFDATSGEDLLDLPCTPLPGTPNPPPRNEVEGSENGNYIQPSMHGFDVKPIIAFRSAVFGPPGIAIVGYMGCGATIDRWTTEREYVLLYNQITDPPSGNLVARTLATRTVGFLSGLIHQNGTVTLSPLIVYETDEELPVPTAGTDYSIELLGDGGQVLATVPFDLTFEIERIGAEEAAVTVDDQVPFGIYFELPAGTQTLRLSKGGDLLEELAKSANPPAVAWVDVVEQPGNELDLEWMASDLDGDDLSYALFYSPNGVALESLAVDLESTTFSVDLDDLTPLAAGGFLRVRASDGWNFAEADFPIGPAFAVLDVDANGMVQPLTDGLLVLRHLFGFSGAPLLSGALGGGCARCVAGDITTYLNGVAGQLDVDGNGGPLQPLNDGLLLLRYLFGFTGAGLTSGAVGEGCTRCDDASIATYLGTLD